MLKTLALFAVTAVAEIAGCYLPYLWLKQGKSIWLLVPAALSLALFAWLLTLHPTAAGRVYAAYGGVYVGVAMLWLWLVDAFDQPTGTCSAAQWPCSAWRSSCSARERPELHCRSDIS